MKLLRYSVYWPSDYNITIAVSKLKMFECLNVCMCVCRCMYACVYTHNHCIWLQNQSSTFWRTCIGFVCDALFLKKSANDGNPKYFLASDSIESCIVEPHVQVWQTIMCAPQVYSLNIFLCLFWWWDDVSLACAYRAYLAVLKVDSLCGWNKSESCEACHARDTNTFHVDRGLGSQNLLQVQLGLWIGMWK